MKSYEALITETLNQRAIIDNRQVVSVQDVTPSVLIAFSRACSEMRDMYNWVWNRKQDTYTTAAGRTSYPLPYGIVKGLTLEDQNGVKCDLNFVDNLTATQGCPTQWTVDWQNEEIAIAPAEKDNQHTMTIEYYDKYIAWYMDANNEKAYLQNFDEQGTVAGTKAQFLNVPELVYDVYAKCITTLARVYLNEGAQPSVFEAQKQEFNNALNSLLEFAKTPFYEAQRFEI